MFFDFGSISDPPSHCLTLCTDLYRNDPCSNLDETTWCVAAYTLQAGSGPKTTSTTGDLVTMHCKYRMEVFSIFILTVTDTYNDDDGLYHQEVSINGEVVSTINSSSGLAQGWGTATECTTAACGTLPSHSMSLSVQMMKLTSAVWIDTTITLDTAYAGYSNTFYEILGATASISTADDGLTWVISNITIPEYTFTTD